MSAKNVLLVFYDLSSFIYFIYDMNISEYDINIADWLELKSLRMAYAIVDQGNSRMILKCNESVQY